MSEDPALKVLRQHLTDHDGMIGAATDHLKRLKAKRADISKQIKAKEAENG